MPFYAVRSGRQIGVYESWGECKRNVSGYSGAQYAKFCTQEQAMAYIKGDKGKSDTIKFINKDLDVFLTNVKEDGNSHNVKPLHTKKADESLMVIYTDGACHDNGHDNPRAGYGYHSFDDPLFFGYGPLPDDQPHTNQRAELTAIREALKNAPSNRAIEIRTDSKYSIDCVNKWYKIWEKKDWQVDKKNLDLIREIVELIRNHSKPIHFEHVKGHSGEIGNATADKLANTGASLVKKKQINIEDA